MSDADQRVAEIARVITAIRSVLGLPPDTRACVEQAFAADCEPDHAALQRLHDALGRVIGNQKHDARKRVRLKRF